MLWYRSCTVNDFNLPYQKGSSQLIQISAARIMTRNPIMHRITHLTFKNYTSSVLNTISILRFFSSLYLAPPYLSDLIHFYSLLFIIKAPHYYPLHICALCAPLLVSGMKTSVKRRHSHHIQNLFNATWGWHWELIRQWLGERPAR